MSVRTSSHVITSAIGDPIELVVTLPQDTAGKKAPITIAFGFQAERSHLPKLACYHYALPSRDGSEIVGTTLLDTSNDWIRDVTRQTATAVSKKFSVPCYVTWATEPNQGYNSINQIHVVKESINFINELRK